MGADERSTGSTRAATWLSSAFENNLQSLGRFAARYGLRVASTIRVAETMEPGPGQIAEAVAAIRAASRPASQRRP